MSAAVVCIRSSQALIEVHLQHQERAYVLERKFGTPVKGLFERLSLKLANATQHNKKQRPDPTAPITALAAAPKYQITLYNPNSEIIASMLQNADMPVEKALAASSFISIDETKYSLLTQDHEFPSGLPVINQIPFVGLPLLLDLGENGGGLSGTFRISWYVVDCEAIPKAPKKKTKSQICLEDDEEQREICQRVISADDMALFQSSGFSMKAGGSSSAGPVVCEDSLHYIPKSEALGKVVIVRVSLRRCGAFAAMTASPYLVQSVAPMESWHVRRLASLPPRKSERTSSLRIVTWNILAPVYSKTPHAQKNIFHYCSKYHLAYAHRKPLILRELITIDSDICGLQEVGREVYQDCIRPLFVAMNMASVYAEKASKASEGLVTAWRPSQFQLIRHQITRFSTAFLEYPEYEDLRNQLDQLWPRFSELVIKRMSAVYSFAVLRPVSTRGQTAFIVANTHLYFHPLASHIRGLQMFVMLTEMKKVRDELVSAGVERVEAVILGDLNADDETAAIDLVVKGSVGEDHDSWRDAVSFGLGGEAKGGEEGDLEEIPSNMSAETFAEGGPLLVSSERLTRGVAEGLLEFTTHVGCFKAILDWIFLTSGLKDVSYCMGGPNSDEIGLGLPSQSFPSDHIPVVVETSNPFLP